MSANRKLQTEIDRTLKKVEEGVEIFDEIWDKVYSATQQNQKEKYEVDLKKEIKKLQRHRDQIKTWVASSDIKDKRPLTDARRGLIETKMEQFKVCEKETKTKTYSKEGLARETKIDPHEAAKNSTRDWLSEKVDQLSLQIDMHEADMEKLTSGKGSKRNKQEIEQLEASIKRHRWHIARLEQITRLLDNDALQHEQINEIKEDVEYYIDANQEPDFMDAYDETMDIFESLDLGDLPTDEDAAAANTDEKKKKKKKGDDDDDDEKDDKKKKKKDKQAEKEAKEEAKKEKKANKAKAATAMPLTIGRATVAKAAPAPVPAAAAPIKGAKGASTTSKGMPTPGVPTPQQVAPPASGAESLANILKQQSAQQQQTGVAMADRLRAQQQQPTAPVPGAAFSAAAQRSQHQQQTSSLCFAPGASLEPLLDISEHMAADDTYVRLLDAQGPSGHDDSASSASAHKLAALALSMRRAPRKADSERPRQYVPRNPYATPPAFPSTPASTFDDAKVFEKLGTDTLFFIFYYQQGTYQQYLAAKELKKQSWRYHKKYMTWFQRHEEPKVTTDEFEQGTYVYFDYETGWCQRIKSDFTFEYNFLEDELVT
ncbi:hypothetical protein AURANDRAFT_55061 [Aureococcus anophagefferens]|uniref:NOT2/NOT3/NOT5 C-terminal domain-containing protein n=1 Tax=Aureococcus anophagefferens TaxID=44056 RepID=F0YJK4_AURAN|nr:hypothetical protein AURANDRAFT_55061 [Aureococcus anophagefferens]EGB04669.1 hypothetical protein AURANDRAFT_55061 [Aureococcus anophagefferens]|eukprot:XP_009040583.1 hypothetical protein AURANDRAFT_55061 [Aureococcus anophagefferens]